MSTTRQPDSIVTIAVMDPIEVARMIDAHIAELLAERNKLRDTLKEIAVMTNPGSRLNYPLDTLDGKLAEIHHKAKTL